jgi:hypothetical protein
MRSLSPDPRHAHHHPRQGYLHGEAPGRQPSAHSTTARGRPRPARWCRDHRAGRAAPSAGRARRARCPGLARLRAAPDCRPASYRPSPLLNPLPPPDAGSLTSPFMRTGWTGWWWRRGWGTCPLLRRPSSRRQVRAARPPPLSPSKPDPPAPAPASPPLMAGGRGAAALRACPSPLSPPPRLPRRPQATATSASSLRAASAA